MKRIVMVFCVCVAVVGLASVGHAQAINDAELFDAASPVLAAHFDQSIVTGQESNAAFVKGVAGTTSIEENTLEGPEVEGIEGLDLDGPGGSTHEFQGEETGDH